MWLNARKLLSSFGGTKPLRIRQWNVDEREEITHLGEYDYFGGTEIYVTTWSLFVIYYIEVLYYNINGVKRVLDISLRYLLEQ